MTVDQARAGLAGLFSLRNVVEAVLSDLTESCWVITLSLSGAWILSVTWILLMRCISGLMVWLSILTVISILAITLTISASRLYHLTHPASQSDLTPSFLADLLGTKQSSWILTILSAAILVCVLLLVFVIRQVCRVM